MILNHFNLQIEKNEFIVIVGPSGSGKSTLLELICGFEPLTDGEIRIDGQDMSQFLPKDRNVAMVFQNYALFPHLTVFENLTFGMKIRKVPKKERNEQALKIAKILELEDYLDVLPKKLSGGQRQRVALGRAIVRNPKLCLMDEPLSNLDAKLRETMSKEIMRIHKAFDGATIYVTHDQTEALTMGDRIVVLDHGKIQQIGTAKEIYAQPKNLFVAQFVGKPEMNFFSIRKQQDKVQLVDFPELLIDAGDFVALMEENTPYLMGIRSEDIQIVDRPIPYQSVEAAVLNLDYLGGETIFHLESQGQLFKAKTLANQGIQVKDNIDVQFNIDKAIIFNQQTTENIRG